MAVALRVGSMSCSTLLLQTPTYYTRTSPPTAFSLVLSTLSSLLAPSVLDFLLTCNKDIIVKFRQLYLLQATLSRYAGQRISCVFFCALVVAARACARSTNLFVTSLGSAGMSVPISIDIGRVLETAASTSWVWPLTSTSTRASG